jgi:hypothetical protein
MPRSSERVRARFTVAVCAAAIAACGGEESPAPPAAGPAQPAPEASRSAGRDPAVAQKQPIGGREVVNPDAETVVLAYYDHARIQPPIDAWVEQDNRVKLAPAIEKQDQRQRVRAELEAAAASARGMGAMRLTMDADLSDYDPTYGEFTVRALAPSHYVSFDAFDQKVSVKFTNGLDAQTWRVPAEEAQLIRDKIGPIRRVSADVLLRIVDVQPAPGGGTFSAEVVEYELRLDPSGQRIGHVEP